MNYNDFDFKIPIEKNTYFEDSKQIIKRMDSILNDALIEEGNKIILNTNLRYGLPLENINKIAGPIIEAWAFELFETISLDTNNNYQLINCEAQSRLALADIVLQFEKTDGSIVTGNVDTKATSSDILTSGKSPNITSFAKIRTAYVEDPDFIFIILSLKHSVYSKRNDTSQLIDGIMEVTAFNLYDLKLISENDFRVNPALGTGQLQINDIHYVDYQERTTWEFCQILDAKYLASASRSIEDWKKLAVSYKWIKDTE